MQRICDRIAIIDKGQILLTGTTAELREQLHAKQEYMIRVTGDIETAKSIAESHHFVESVKVGVDSLIVTIDDPFENNSRLMQDMLAAGVNIIEFAEEEASLEDLYLEILNGGGD
ncbi:MAG: ATP-binding protein DrrA1-3 family domain-containing protein [Candidatus Thorarchaeota archaeon]